MSVLSQLWDGITESWRSTSIIAFVTGAIGTAFGAWLTSRAAAKRRVIDELKAIRAAYALCQTITNKALAVKRQHIKPTKERYDQAQIAFVAHQWNPQGPLSLQLDLNTLSQLSFPGDRLLAILFEKSSVNMKALTLAVQTQSSTEDFRASINVRNDLIDEFKKNTPPTPMAKFQFYFGLPGQGMIDLRFRNNIEALTQQVDDCIMFSLMLGEELVKAENAFQRRYRFRFRLGFRKMIPADWGVAYAAGLIPARLQYADWDEKFVYPPSRWRRFKRAFKSGNLRDWLEVP